MDDREEKVRRRAYDIWEREGREHGRDKEHWRRATEEVEPTSEAEARPDAAASGAPEGAAAPGTTSGKIGEAYQGSQRKRARAAAEADASHHGSKPGASEAPLSAEELADDMGQSPGRASEAQEGEKRASGSSEDADPHRPVDPENTKNADELLHDTGVGQE
jgi:hypothetical protein